MTRIVTAQGLSKVISRILAVVLWLSRSGTVGSTRYRGRNPQTGALLFTHDVIDKWGHRCRVTVEEINE